MHIYMYSKLIALIQFNTIQIKHFTNYKHTSIKIKKIYILIIPNHIDLLLNINNEIYRYISRNIITKLSIRFKGCESTLIMLELLQWPCHSNGYDIWALKGQQANILILNFWHLKGQQVLQCPSLLLVETLLDFFFFSLAFSAD